MCTMAHRATLLLVLLSAIGCGGATPQHEEVLRGTLDALEDLTAALAAVQALDPTEEQLGRLDEAIDGLADWLDRAPHLPPLSPEEESTRP